MAASGNILHASSISYDVCNLFYTCMHACICICMLVCVVCMCNEFKHSLPSQYHIIYGLRAQYMYIANTCIIVATYIATYYTNMHAHNKIKSLVN